MTITDIIGNYPFITIHNFLCAFVFDTENKINTLLEVSAFKKFLITKHLDLGRPMKPILHRKQQKMTLINYSLTYVFFEDKEDEFGQRPNDIHVGFVAQLSDNEDYIISQSVTSDLIDYDFEELRLVGALNDTIKTKINNIQPLFINSVKEYIKCHEDLMAAQV